MASTFVRGTLYANQDRRPLAEIYCYLQLAPGTERRTERWSGFLEPLVEYEPLEPLTRKAASFLLELDDGRKGRIRPDRSFRSFQAQSAIFFQGHGSTSSEQIDRDGSTGIALE